MSQANLDTEQPALMAPREVLTTGQNTLGSNPLPPLESKPLSPEPPAAKGSASERLAQGQQPAPTTTAPPPLP